MVVFWFEFRAQVQENIDMIRLQREVKEKSGKLEQVQARYADLEDVGLFNHQRVTRCPVFSCSQHFTFSLTSLFLILFARSQKLRTVKNSHDQLLREMEKLNAQLKEEQDKVLVANNELKSGSAHQRRIVEVRTSVEPEDPTGQ